VEKDDGDIDVGPGAAEERRKGSSKLGTSTISVPPGLSRERTIWRSRRGAHRCSATCHSVMRSNGRGKGAGHIVEARLSDVEVEVFAGVLGGVGAGSRPATEAAGAVAQGGEEAARLQADIKDARPGVQGADGKTRRSLRWSMRSS